MVYVNGISFEQNELDCVHLKMKSYFNIQRLFITFLSIVRFPYNHFSIQYVGLELIALTPN